MKRIILSLALIVASTLPASAGKLVGVEMSDASTAGDQALVLNGMALRKKFFIKVYVAGLYLPAKESDGAKVLATDGARKTVMHFIFNVGKEKICEGWNEGLEANTPDASAALHKDFARLCSMMEDVKKGERLEFTYLPGTGTEVLVKGKSKGTIAGKEFADALFASWIGEHPGPGQDFKDDLLGK